MDDESLSEGLARRHVALRLDQLPEPVVESAKLHVLDTLGCLLAGSRLQPGKLAYDLVLAPGPHAAATLFGREGRAEFGDAVQAMSTAAHCGELDDIHGGAGTCIGAMIVPALLACAERFRGDGRSFLEAVVVGYETIVRVGLAIDAPALFARGWWPSTICGGIGVAAAGAKFLRWPEGKSANAIGIAALHAGGMITGGPEGATARHLAFGAAARNGILALLAAEQGFTGPKRAFEDARGFCLTLCAKPLWEHLRDAARFQLLDVAFKPYPCARQLHAAVEALLTLIKRHAITENTIREIELSVPSQNVAMLNRPALPSGHAAAVGSGQYVMAVTALRGRLDLTSFDREYLRSDEVRRLMAKVKVGSDPALDRHFPKHWAGKVCVKLMDGRSCIHEVVIPKGEPGNPMTAGELEEKFLALAAPVLGDDRARNVIDHARCLDAGESLTELLCALRRPT